MDVIIRSDANAAARLTARLIARRIRAKPDLVLGLATGRTMEHVYAQLVQMHQQDGLDFSLCRTFNLDEYIGLSGDDPGSYRRYMNEQLFNHVNLDIRNTHLPNGTAQNVMAECRRYEARIKELGGIDLQLLGIGRSGHVGFNEPLSALRSRTRDKTLTPTTMAQNAPLFDSPADMPTRGITMGVGTILESKQCLLLATGAEKATIIAKAVEGPITAMVSATALQLHAHCHVIVDEAAAADLEGADYYRWVFVNEPEWAKFREEDA